MSGGFSGQGATCVVELGDDRLAEVRGHLEREREGCERQQNGGVFPAREWG